MGEAANVIRFSSPEDEERWNANRARRQRGEGTPPTGHKLLPHDLEAEAGVIAAVCVDPALLEAMHAQGVNVGVFYERPAGDAWAAAWYLLEQRAEIDAGVLYAELVRIGKVDAAKWVLEASARFPTSAQAAHHAKVVVGLALRRRIIRLAAEAIEGAHATTGDAQEFAAELSQKILAVTGDRSGLPAILSTRELMAKPLPEPPMLIDQVMHQGRRTLLLAPSKASKTWTAMSMSVAIASGKAWLGFRTHRAKVLHIDLELPDWGLKQRMTKLCELMQVKPDELDVDWWSLDGYQRSIDELLPLITARAPLGRFGLIVVEPAYVILGRRDENDNADVTDFMNRLAWLARMTGAAVLCTHHFAKGDASKKEAKDRGSGAGAWMRAPDTAITLTPLDESQGEDCYSMEFIERNMKRHAPVGVQFEYPIFRLRSGLDLSALREPGRPRESTDKDLVRVLEDAGPLTYTQLERASKMSESTFKRRLKEALAADRITQCGSLYSVASGEGPKL